MNKEKLEEAYDFAIEAHRGQYRRDFPLPYSTHVIQVYKRVFDYGIRDYEVLMAALLHDIIEDTKYPYEYIEAKFGKRVADIVLECSRTGGDHVGNNHKLQFMKSFYKKSNESIVIKIADRFCNVMDYYQAGRPVYAAWYALQAYPLIDKYMDIISNNEMPEYIHLDVKNIIDRCQYRFSYNDPVDVIDKILMNSPIE